MNSAQKGSFHEIKAGDKMLVNNFQVGATAKLRVHVAPGVSTCSLLCCADKPPKSLFIGGDEVRVSIKEDISVALLSQLIQNPINKTKVQIVAANNSATIAKECAQ